MKSIPAPTRRNIALIMRLMMLNMAPIAEPMRERTMLAGLRMEMGASLRRRLFQPYAPVP